MKTETIITIACPCCKSIISGVAKNSVTVDWTEEVAAAKEKGFIVSETTETVTLNKCTCSNTAIAYGNYAMTEVRIQLPLSAEEVELMYLILVERNNANERNRKKTLSGQKAESSIKRDAYDAENNRISRILQKLTNRIL